MEIHGILHELCRLSDSHIHHFGIWLEVETFNDIRVVCWNCKSWFDGYSPLSQELIKPMDTSLYTQITFVWWLIHWYMELYSFFKTFPTWYKIGYRATSSYRYAIMYIPSYDRSDYTICKSLELYILAQHTMNLTTQNSFNIFLTGRTCQTFCNLQHNLTCPGWCF